MSIDPTQFVSPDGRLNRRLFWSGAIILIVAQMVLSVIPIGRPVAGILAIWPWYCLIARRLHDTGRTSRYAAFAVLPMALGAVVSLIAFIATAAPALSIALLPIVMVSGLAVGVASLVALGFVIWIGSRPGDAAANHWGHPSQGGGLFRVGASDL